MPSENLRPYLQPGFFIDSDHPRVIEYAEQLTVGLNDPVQTAVKLYYAIRDGYRYNPYRIKRLPEDYKASTLLTRPISEGGHCIDKAGLLAACARVKKIPSRMHFANVRNHIGIEKLQKILGTDLLYYHGYAELYLGGKWLAVTPAFNQELCRYLNVAPIEFDGTEDSIFQEFDKSGNQFMEYVDDHGAFSEIPFEAMMAVWEKHYTGVVLEP